MDVGEERFCGRQERGGFREPEVFGGDFQCFFSTVFCSFLVFSNALQCFRFPKDVGVKVKA